MKQITTVLKILSLLCIFVMVTNYIYKLTVQKVPEYYCMDEFKDIDNNMVDVLAIGSSHAYTSFDTEMLWEQYGIAGFCISSPGQSLATSYYFLKEALKTQNPKVVMLECSCINEVVLDYEYGNISSISWMKPSLNKIKMIENTIPEKYQRSMTSSIFYFHNRWRDLDDKDFDYISHRNIHDTKGFIPWWNSKDFYGDIVRYDLENTVGLQDEAIKYMDEIIDMCNSRNIIFVPYISPHPFSEEHYMQINEWRKFFENKNVNFIDGVQISEEIKINPHIDNAANHISYWGAEKLSNYIGEYLRNVCDIEDRRGDSKYKDWYNNFRYNAELESCKNLINVLDVDEYINKVATVENCIVIMQNVGCDWLLEPIGFTEQYESKSIAVFYHGRFEEIECGENAQLKCLIKGEIPYGVDLGSILQDNKGYWETDLYVEKDYDDFYLNIDYTRQSVIDTSGMGEYVTMYVYSPIEHGMVDKVLITAENELIHY